LQAARCLSMFSIGRSLRSRSSPICFQDRLRETTRLLLPEDTRVWNISEESACTKAFSWTWQH
jgi:hypothetical protein